MVSAASRRHAVPCGTPLSLPRIFPDIHSVPKTINTSFLPLRADNLAIYKSKAVGEPPLMYGIGAYFAIRNAIQAFNPTADFDYVSPITPERVLLALYSKTKEDFIIDK